MKKIAASPGAPSSLGSISGIAAVIDKKEETSDSKKALMCSLLFSAAASSPKDAPLLDILAHVDYSKLTWDDMSYILKEGFTQIEKDSSVPELERILARIAEKGRNASLSQVLDDERAGKMAFDSLKEIYSYITYMRKKHEATQEIKEMAENVSDSRKPEKINVVEDDGSQFIEIDGIKLFVHETKSS
ncbi:MAG: hypothetical protein AB2L14_34950 [Candidatus Xenobiia bacterium LiM19]